MQLKHIVLIAYITCHLQMRAQEVSIPQVRPIDDQLHSYGIRLDEESLIQALRNPDPEVRTLAAFKLADDRAFDAESAISAALSAEKVPEIKLQQAFALAELGGEQGFATLHGFCSDQNTRVTLRLLAAQDIQRLGREDCVSTVVDLAQLKNDDDSAREAISILSGFRLAYKKDPDELHKAITSALTSSSPTLRATAGRTLAELEGLNALPYLEAAATNEKDSAVRAQINAQIERLLRETAKAKQ